MSMEKHCANCDEKQSCVPFFTHENAMMHYNSANRRMLIALVAVCLTFIITIVVFVTGYTTRERNWLDTIRTMQNGVTDGRVYEQQNP